MPRVKTIKTVDDIPNETKDEIITYCYGVMRGVNSGYLKKMQIRPNLFIEVLYDTAVNNFLGYSDYHLSPQDLKNVYSYSKNIDDITKNFINGRVELMGIDNNDQFYFKIQRLIA